MLYAYPAAREGAVVDFGGVQLAREGVAAGGWAGGALGTRGNRGCGNVPVPVFFPDYWSGIRGSRQDQFRHPEISRVCSSHARSIAGRASVGAKA